MSNKKSVVKIGKLTKKLCQKYGITYGIGFDIVQSKGLIYHVQKHINDFNNVNNYALALSNVSKILSSPNFVYFDNKRNSIKFFKKITQYICVVVNIEKEVAYVATIYPINKKKIEKLKQKVMNNKIGV